MRSQYINGKRHEQTASLPFKKYKKNTFKPKNNQKTQILKATTFTN